MATSPRVMHSRYGCSVFGVEANPALASAVNKQSGIVCKNAAVSAFDGFVKFSVDEEDADASKIVSESTPISRTVIAVPSMSLSTLLREAKAEQIDLLKIDVEGAELDIIETTNPETFRRCTQIAVEFHSFLYPSHTERIEEAITRLSRHGFHYIDFSTDRTDVLFLNSGLIDISVAAKAVLGFHKYQAGIMRRLRRIARREV